MLIKFTNATNDHKGNPIYINPEHIVAVYEIATTPGGSLTTVVYGGPTGLQWFVEESMEQVVKTIKLSESTREG
jgi:hypothetical protein